MKTKLLIIAIAAPAGFASGYGVAWLHYKHALDQLFMTLIRVG